MPFNPALCEGCALQGKFKPTRPSGPADARFAVITDGPSKARPYPLGPAAIKVFGRQMLEAGFEKDDFRFIPLRLCACDTNDYKNKELAAINKHCRQHLLHEIEQQQPELVIPLGPEAATAAFGRGTKIGGVKGKAHDSAELERPIFPLSSPAAVVSYPQNGPIFAADCATMARYIHAGYDREAAAGSVSRGDYRIVDDLQFLIDWYRDNPDQQLLSFDMETTGLRWYKRGVNVRTYRESLHKGSTLFSPRFQILTMQFSRQPGEGFMLVWDHPEAPIPEERKAKLRNQLRQLLCDPDRIVVGHNGKFDNVGLWMTEGIRYRQGGDSMMLTAMLDENLTEKNLDAVTKIHVPEMAGYADEFNRTVNKERMWEVPLAQMLPYGCGDTDAALRVYLTLEEQCAEDEKLWAHYAHVAMPGLNALAAMETRGMYTDDRLALPQFKELMQREVEEMRARLLDQLPKDLKRDIVHEYLNRPGNRGKTAEDALSFSRPEFLRQILFTHKKGFRLQPKVFTKTTAKLNNKTLREPSISSKDHLPYFFDDCPFTLELATYIKDSKLLGTNVVKFEENYIHDGKVRPVYQLHKTVTGRTSSEDPNGQNYPKRGKRAMAYRKMFVAPEGYYVCELDLSQAELRIAASMSGDPTMLEIYRTGGDIHTATAKIVLGVNDEQWELLSKAEKKDARTKAKSVNFGFLYGMGWKSFIGFAKTQYGVDFTEEEAIRVRKNFFKKYRRLEPWHERVRAFAGKHKYVRSYTGRVRHLPMMDSADDWVRMEAERQAINSPVQETGSSLGVMALGRMNEELDPAYIQIVGFIHDAIVVYIKKEYLDWGMRTVKRYMQTNPLREWFGTEIQCPIVADCGFGHDLSNIIECEGFSLDEPFNYDGLRDKEGKLLIEVPPQMTPPNDGRLTRSIYTLPTDLEDEDAAPVKERRARLVIGTRNADVLARIERSTKQMEINRRNQAKQREQAKIMRRTRRPAAVA